MLNNFTPIVLSLLHAAISASDKVNDSEIAKFTSRHSKALLAIAFLSATFSFGQLKKLEHQQGQALFNTVLPAFSYMSELDRKRIRDYLKTSASTYDQAEQQLITNEVSQNLLLNTLVLNDLQKGEVQNLHKLMIRINSKKGAMDDEMTNMYMGAVASSVIRVCELHNAAQYGYESICESAQSYFTNGGYLPVIQEKLNNEASDNILFFANKTIT